MRIFTLLSVLFCVLVFTVSCKQYSYIRDFNVAENNVKLPKLEPVSDHNIFNYRSLNKDEDSFSEYIGPDQNRLKISSLFNDYIINDLCKTNEDQAGQAILHINYLNITNEHNILGMLSATLLLGIPNFLGVPFGYNETNLDITIEIKDCSNKTLASYSGNERKKSFVALYYGYNRPDATERGLLECIESCLNDINNQISKDYEILMKRLTECEGKSGTIY